MSSFETLLEAKRHPANPVFSFSRSNGKYTPDHVVEARRERRRQARQQKRLENLRRSRGTHPRQILGNENGEFTVDFIRFMADKGMPGSEDVPLPITEQDLTFNLFGSKRRPARPRTIRGYRIGCVAPESLANRRATSFDSFVCVDHEKMDYPRVYICEDEKLRMYSQEALGATDVVIPAGKKFHMGHVAGVNQPISFRPQDVQELLLRVAEHNVPGA
ncbi:MAG TPA: hypothetical protein VFK11_01820 [Candidatus Saccharimonadales bacterium]|nr:hypothetical protein [Candidatus Saccharimonadales bacterium]